MIKRARYGLFALALVAAILLGCQSQGSADVVQEAEPTTATTMADDQPAAEPNAANPPQGRPGDLLEAVLDTNLLALGILELEETPKAVTLEQAAALLPFWQMIADGGLWGDAETAAVMKQIQAALTESQQAAIAAMDLAVEDQQAWMAEQGIEMPAGDGFQPPEGAGERPAGGGEGQRPEGAGERPAGGGEGQPPEGVGFRGGNVIVRALVDLLTTRAGE
ncbi:MAG: hypothetical protein ACP5JG_09840 [Anaerolineae bacterium]